MCFNICNKIRSWWRSRKEKKSRKTQEQVDKQSEDVHRDDMLEVREEDKENPVTNWYEDTQIDNTSYILSRICRSDPGVFTRTLGGEIPKVYFVTRYERISCQIGGNLKVSHAEKTEKKLWNVKIAPKDWVQFEESARRSPGSIIPTLPPPPVVERRKDNAKVSDNTGDGMRAKLKLNMEDKSSAMEEPHKKTAISPEYPSGAAAKDTSSSDDDGDHHEKKTNLMTDVAPIHTLLKLQPDEKYPDSVTAVADQGIEAELAEAETSDIMKGTIIEAPADSCGTAVNPVDFIKTIEEQLEIDASSAVADELNQTGISAIRAEETDPVYVKNLTDDDCEFTVDLTSESTLDDCNTTHSDGVSKHDTEDLNSIGTPVNDSSVK